MLKSSGGTELCVCDCGLVVATYEDPMEIFDSRSAERKQNFLFMMPNLDSESELVQHIYWLLL